MDNSFDTLINTYIENHAGIDEHFLSIQLATSLRQNLITRFENKELFAAGTGNQSIIAHDKLLRGDLICWLDPSHNDQHENSFFDLIDKFIQYLNTSCYTGITGYEFHYTLYERGTFYKKHIDQFQNNNSRAFSMIMYLNEGWQKEDGGELCLYHADHQEIISPISGTCVFFKSSELKHEVLITHQPRLSITGWLKVN